MGAGAALAGRLLAEVFFAVTAARFDRVAAPRACSEAILRCFPLTLRAFKCLE
jgi:hypothetical protein